MKLYQVIPLILVGPLLLAAFNSPPSEPLAPAALDQSLDGSLIPVYTGSLRNMSKAASAYSSASGQYLVVIENGDGQILMRYIDGETGVLLGSGYPIVAVDGAYNPDVVYDSNNDRFLIVWDELLCMGFPEKCYYVIIGRLVYGGYKDNNWFAGAEFDIANEHNNMSTAYDLREPSAAYNKSDAQYVVLYRYGHESSSYPSIYGQIVSAAASDPQVETGVFLGFEINSYSGGWEVVKPDVAWSRYENTFLAVWQNYHDTQLDTISARYLYDYYRNGLSQVYGGNPFKVAPYNEGGDPLENACSYPSIAYDPMNKHYTVVFEHREGTGFAASYTIHAQRLKGYFNENVNREGYAFPVETDTSQVEFRIRPEIAYSGFGAGLYVVFVSWDLNDPGEDYYRIHERTLRNTVVGHRLKIHEAPPDIGVDNPAVAGTEDGRALVVWDETNMVSGRDVFAQRLNPQGLIMLPVVFKD